MPNAPRSSACKILLCQCKMVCRTVVTTGVPFSFQHPLYAEPCWQKLHHCWKHWLDWKLLVLQGAGRLLPSSISANRLPVDVKAGTNIRSRFLSVKMKATGPVAKARLLVIIIPGGMRLRHLPQW